MQEEPKDKTQMERTMFAKKAQDLMRSRYGVSLLATISFIESFLPVPILSDPFLAAAILIDQAKVKKMVLVTMVSSVVGGCAAFLVAVYFRDTLFSLLSPEMAETLNSFIAKDQDTFMLTIVGAITPIPYTIVAWTVALSHGNPLVFIAGSIVGRSIRYGIIGWCTNTFGPTALKYAQRSIFLTSLIIFILAGLYIWMKV